MTNKQVMCNQCHTFLSEKRMARHKILERCELQHERKWKKLLRKKQEAALKIRGLPPTGTTTRRTT